MLSVNMDALLVVTIAVGGVMAVVIEHAMVAAKIDASVLALVVVVHWCNHIRVVD